MLKQMKPYLFLGALMLGTLGALSAPALAVASNFTVTKTADTDDGICNTDCSLREAIGAANDAGGSNAIDFAATVFAAPRKTITLGLGQLSVNSGTLSITAPSAGVTITVSSQRVFFHRHPSQCHPGWIQHHRCPE